MKFISKNNLYEILTTVNWLFISAFLIKHSHKIDKAIEKLKTSQEEEMNVYREFITSLADHSTGLMISIIIGLFLILLFTNKA